MALRLSAFALAAVFVASCSGTSSNAVARDASGWIACRDFERAMVDVRKGIVTTPEFRTSLQEVQANARLSSSTQIVAASEALLRSVTTGTTQDAVVATQQFSSACAKAFPDEFKVD